MNLQKTVIVFTCLALFLSCTAESVLDPSLDESIYTAGASVSVFQEDHALEFDGSNDFLNMFDRDALEMGFNDMTISLWFKTPRTGVQQQLFRKGYDSRTDGEGRYVIKVFETNQVRIVVDDDANSPGSTLIATGTTIVTDDEWHSLVVAFDRDVGLYVFLDGVQDLFTDDLLQQSASISNSDEVNVYVGRGNGKIQMFEGQIDDIRVWNTVKLPGNASETFGNIKEPQASQGLIGQWTLDDGLGQVARDHVGGNGAQLGGTPAVDGKDPAWVLRD